MPANIDYQNRPGISTLRPFHSTAELHSKFAPIVYRDTQRVLISAPNLSSHQRTDGGEIGSWTRMEPKMVRILILITNAFQIVIRTSDSCSACQTMQIRSRDIENTYFVEIQIFVKISKFVRMPPKSVRIMSSIVNHSEFIF